MFDKDGQYVVFMTGATAIAYDPKQVSPAPTSWNDLFDRKYAGRMALGGLWCTDRADGAEGWATVGE